MKDVYINSILERCVGKPEPLLDMNLVYDAWVATRDEGSMDDKSDKLKVLLPREIIPIFAERVKSVLDLRSPDFVAIRPGMLDHALPNDEWIPREFLVMLSNLDGCNRT